jgi:1-phosphatidylinositol-3-phosphate 5-kinase
MDQPSDSERENELKRDRSRRKYLEFLTADSILPHPLQSSDNFSESGEFTSKDSNNHMEESGPRESGNLQNSKTVHVKVSFSDDEPEGNVKYTVTCYFARQFDALRRTCCPDQVDFIRSLCHCKNWSARGKSNVFFAKTKDERFVIKQVTKTELESFIKFAPEYFKYLSESLKTGSPTCLAKILGIFQVLCLELLIFSHGFLNVNALLNNLYLYATCAQICL